MSVTPWLPAHPLVFVVGQSVGPAEARRDRPFIGPAGQQLRAWLRAVGLDPDADVAYTNVVMDYHPEAPNYVPSKAEIAVARGRIAAQLEAFAPRAVLLVGSSAAHLLFKGTMTQMQGRRAEWAGVPTWACFHPSYYLRARNYQRRAEIEGAVLAVLREVSEAARGQPVAPVTLPTPRYATPRFLGAEAIDTETEGEKRSDTADPRRARLRCLASWPEGVVTLTRPHIPAGAHLLVHNHPYDAVVLGIWDAVWDDTKMVAWLGGEPDTTLKGLVTRYLGKTPMYYEEAVETGKLEAYCLADAQHTWELMPLLRAALSPLALDLYQRLEQPLLPLWARMTLEGSYYLDYGGLRQRAEELEAEIVTAAAEAEQALPRGYEVTRCTVCGADRTDAPKGCGNRRAHSWKGGTLYDPEAPTDLDSPTKLLAALRSMGHRINSTGAEVLGPLGIRDPAIAALLRYRAKTKLLHTYVEPWLTVPEGSRLGAVWRPTGTWTGRVSSARPNLQNVPHELERFWLAPEGYRFLTFDNAQLEVRIAAHLSQDPTLLAASRGGDFHATMMRAFALTERRRAKVWLFGSLYLGGPGLMVREAAKQGEVLDYNEARMAQAVVHQALPDYFGWAHEVSKLRHVPGLFGATHVIPPGDDEEERGRQAVNAPIQGGAGRVCKWQMLALHRAGYKVVSQVHDSITIEVRETDYEAARVEAKRLMEGAVELDVPILVEEKSHADETIASH